jgi:ankyrin repeat protein
LKEEEMEHFGSYKRSAPAGYQAVRQKDDGTCELVPTEAQKALKIVDPYGLQFPTKEEKSRFCDFFDIFAMDAEHEAAVQHFFGCYCAYLFPKGNITEDQRNFVNAIGKDSENPLARAIQLETPDLNLIRDLVACGAELNRPCTNSNFRGGRMTPLVLAVRFGHPATIQPLVQAGADIDQIDKSTGQTPLLFALSSDLTCGAAGFLVRSGAKVDCRDLSGRTALQYAIRWGERDLVSLLIEKRAPFDWACYNQLVKAPELLAHVRKEHPNLIALIVNRGDPALIPALVNQGFDIEARGPDGYTALHVAVANGNQAIVLQLLSLRADINAVRQPQSMTPLSFAIFGKNLSMFNLLKDNGADLGLLTKFDREAYEEFFSGTIEAHDELSNAFSS